MTNSKRIYTVAESMRVFEITEEQNEFIYILQRASGASVNEIIRRLITMGMDITKAEQVTERRNKRLHAQITDEV